MKEANRMRRCRVTGEMGQRVSVLDRVGQGGFSKQARYPKSRENVVQVEGIASVKALKQEQVFLLGRKERSPWVWRKVNDEESIAKIRGGKEFISNAR